MQESGPRVNMHEPGVKQSVLVLMAWHPSYLQKVQYTEFRNLQKGKFT